MYFYVVILALLMVVFLFPITSLAHHPLVDISISDQEFVPKKLNIKLGSEVIFKNDGLKDHWPASDIHPNHGIYPEFDPQRGLRTGESWSFKFDKAGEWKFHDHLNPSMTGVISVKGKENDQNILGELKDRWTSFHEWLNFKILNAYYSLFPNKLDERFSKVSIAAISQDESRLKYWLELKKPEEILSELLSESEGGKKFDCHRPAHRIGRAAYLTFGPKAFETGDSSCFSGYYHGAMEGMLYEKGTDDISATADEICSHFKTEFGKFECFHGIGHGIMAYLNNDLPEAINLCQKLENPDNHFPCISASFMENQSVAVGIGANLDHQTKWVSNDPHFPCNSVEKEKTVQEACYGMQTSWMQVLFKNNFDRIQKECLNAPEAMVKVCFMSYGRDAAWYTKRDPKKTLALCDKVDEKYYTNCVVGAIYDVLDFWGTKITTQADEFCNHVTENSAKDRCLNITKNRLKDLSKSN